MQRKLRFTKTADQQLSMLEKTPSLKGVLKQVNKTLGYLETNLEAKSLQTHPHHYLTSRYKIPIFESYAQHNTPGAYRVYWHYGPDEEASGGKRIPVITVVDIMPDPSD